MNENKPATAPWLPSDPVQGGTCTTGAFFTGPGEGFQEVSIMTGGLRFPICQFAAFDVVFQTIATSVIDGAVVACEFDLPTPPNGQNLDLASVEVTSTAGATVENLSLVADAILCVDGAFYIDGPQIHLCPQACSRISTDPAAELSSRFDCLADVE